MPPRVPDYELLRCIGRGGYGEVWLARGLTGVFRAVKIVWRDRFADAQPYEREFRGVRESMTHSLEAGQLALLHVGEDEAGGFFYYVMELADDTETGREVKPAEYTPLTFKELKAKRGWLPAGECVRLATELARALARLHGRGLVHRDIKPSNIVLVNGTPKLADIGLVAASAEALTFVGTQGYVPPEGPGSPAADVFALGRVIYELLTGCDRDEFPRLRAEVAADERRQFFGLNQVILRACEPRAEDRYRNAAELLAALEALQNGARRPARAWWYLGTAAVAAAGAVAWFATHHPENHAVVAPAAPAVRTVAVLPFANLSGDRDQEYFSDGVTEEILNTLARERGLRVAAPTSSFSFKGHHVPTAEIARQLHVSQLVEGSVRRMGNRVRIAVQLTHAADGFSVSLGSFDGDLSDIFALQEEVGRVVLARLTGRPVPGNVGGPPMTHSTEAYDAYLRGKALRQQTADNSLAAIEQFERAVTLDPRFAQAWAEMALAYFRQASVRPGQRAAMFAKCAEAVVHALELQPDLPLALVVRANWRRAASSDLAGAAADLARAQAREPGTIELRMAQASLARDEGDWATSLACLEQAVELDPNNGDVVEAAAANYAFRGRITEADRLLARAAVIQAPASDSATDERVLLRLAWRGPAAAVRLLDRQPPPSDAAQKPAAAFRRLELLGRNDEACALARTIEREADESHPDGGGTRIGLMDLLSVGAMDLARERAERFQPRWRQRYDAGDRNAQVLAQLVRSEIALGHPDAALAVLQQWRAFADGLPSYYQRLAHLQAAIGCYALLGRAEEAVALLRDAWAHGYRAGLIPPEFHGELARLRGNPLYDAWAKDLRDYLATQPDPADDPLATAAALREAAAAYPPSGTAVPAAAAATDAGSLRPASPADAAVANERRPASAAPMPRNKVVAVLPLENLSPDPNDAFFAAGVHEELVSALANLRSIRVISRTSVMQYRGTNKTIGQIARELGVAYVLEGTVRRAGNRVRVTGQFIDAATDEPVWSKSFDRDLQDIFSVQSELAREIAGALDATLSPAEVARLQSRPTSSLAAYECLQKARALARGLIDAHDLKEQVLPLLERAVALDPAYSEAWVELATQSMTLYTLEDHTAARLASARNAVAQAEQLAPESYGVLSTQAEFAVLAGDRPTVDRLRQRIVTLYPQRPEAHLMMALSAQHDERWTDARAEFRAALQIDPRNPEVLENYFSFLDSMRVWDEAESVASTLLEVQPDSYDQRLVAASMEFRHNGSTAKLTRLLGTLPRDDEGGASVTAVRVRIAFLTGDWRGIVGLWRETGPRFRTGGYSAVTARLMVAGAFLKLGDPASARPLLEQCREENSRHLKDDPTNVSLLNESGVILGMLGDRAGARAALDRAKQILDTTRDANWMFSGRWDNTVARCWVDDDKARVIKAIEPLLRERRPRSPVQNVHVLRVSWVSIPLQGDPAFEAMLDDPKNNAPLL